MIYHNSHFVKYFDDFCEEDETSQLSINTFEQNKDNVSSCFSSLTFTPLEAPIAWPNIIVYGAPGTGKSYALKNKVKETLELESADAIDPRYERVTFHPDYSYANFVGTYKPVSKGDGKIDYEYVPGPFMRVLTKALKSGMSDTPQTFILVIEEINRAKSAAVFGDIFQLLDRTTDNGDSEYAIATTEDMRKYLADKLSLDESQLETIKIPNNMLIWATMNSADQGVSLMDTAFKRRWSFDYISVDANAELLTDEPILSNAVIDKGDADNHVTWDKIRQAINKFLSEKNVNEDKLMGPFFISKKDLSDKKTFNETFKNKVLMYLFEDIKVIPNNILFDYTNFKDENKNRFSGLCAEFDEKGIAIFNSVITEKVKHKEVKTDDSSENE